MVSCDKPETNESLIGFSHSHSDLKVASSQTKINEKFSNYFLQTVDKNKWFIALKCTCQGLQKEQMS